MKNYLVLLFAFFCTTLFSQKDSLQLGDKYADDQIYALINYNQFYSQPDGLTNSSFSYGLSAGYLKDIILNKRGSLSFALGVGYGLDIINHSLKVEEVNNQTQFSDGNTLTSNQATIQNLEFPLELRWRTSTANRYKFWRIYTGVKLTYNLSNTFEFEENNTITTYSNVTAFRKLQYGLTISAGYDAFNVNFYYGLTPLFENATLNGNPINTKLFKLGLAFYIL